MKLLRLLSKLNRRLRLPPSMRQHRDSMRVRAMAIGDYVAAGGVAAEVPVVQPKPQT